jgi:hypothetical protein
MTQPKPEMIRDYSLRLTHKQYSVLLIALATYYKQHLGVAPAAAQATRALLLILPRQAPYQVYFSQHDWDTISRALRAGGSNPQAGSPEARQYALYQLIRRKLYPDRAQRPRGLQPL